MERNNWELMSPRGGWAAVVLWVNARGDEERCLVVVTAEKLETFLLSKWKIVVSIVILAFSLLRRSAARRIVPLTPRPRDRTPPWQKLASLSPRLHRLSIANSHTYPTTATTPTIFTTAFKGSFLYTPRTFSTSFTLSTLCFRVFSPLSLMPAAVYLYTVYVHKRIPCIRRSRHYHGNRIPRALFARSVHAMHRCYYYMTAEVHERRDVFISYIICTSIYTRYLVCAMFFVVGVLFY